MKGRLIAFFLLVGEQVLLEHVMSHTLIVVREIILQPAVVLLLLRHHLNL